MSKFTKGTRIRHHHVIDGRWSSLELYKEGAIAAFIPGGAAQPDGYIVDVDVNTAAPAAGLHAQWVPADGCIEARP